MAIFSEKEMKAVIYPLLKKIREQYQQDKTTIIGIQGGQGTGKTTLVKLLAELLKSKGFKVQSFSLDDFYSSYRERKQLAQRYPGNVFYQIPRGMPGTHRLGLLKRTLTEIKLGHKFEIPVFDKSVHDGSGDISSDSVSVAERPDFVLLEGWCLGLPLFTLPELKKICQKYQINLRQLDPRGTSTKLLLDYAKKYQSSWKLIDYWIKLKPDSPQLHFKWRWQQETELRQRTGEGMAFEEIQHFVSIFLPLTYVCYEKLKADVLVKINAWHEFYGTVFN